MAEERVQRRLAAILAADVVGYSRMMHEDETGTLAQLKAVRKELLDPKVEEYSGRVVKTTGDGTLIEFLARLGNLWVSLGSERWRLGDLQKSVKALAGGIKGTLLLLGAMVDKGSAVIAARAGEQLLDGAVT